MRSTKALAPGRIKKTGKEASLEKEEQSSCRPVPKPLPRKVLTERPNHLNDINKAKSWSLVISDDGIEIVLSVGQESYRPSANQVSNDVEPIPFPRLCIPTNPTNLTKSTKTLKDAMKYPKMLFFSSRKERIPVTKTSTKETCKSKMRADTGCTAESNVSLVVRFEWRRCAQ